MKYMTVQEAKEQQRMAMQSVLSLIKNIIDIPGDQTGYRGDAAKLKGIRDRITRLDREMGKLFDSIPEEL